MPNCAWRAVLLPVVPLLGPTDWEICKATNAKEADLFLSQFRWIGFANRCLGVLGRVRGFLYRRRRRLCRRAKCVISNGEFHPVEMLIRGAWCKSPARGLPQI